MVVGEATQKTEVKLPPKYKVNTNTSFTVANWGKTKSAWNLPCEVGIKPNGKNNGREGITPCKRCPHDCKGVTNINIVMWEQKQKMEKLML